MVSCYINPLAPKPPFLLLPEPPVTTRPFFMCSSIPCMGFTMIILYVRDPYDVYNTILHRQMYATIKKNAEALTKRKKVLQNRAQRWSILAKMAAPRRLYSAAQPKKIGNRWTMLSSWMHEMLRRVILKLI